MPRYAKPSKNRWVHPLYVRAFCYPHNGKVYTSVNGVRKATNLRWVPQNRTIAMQILTERIQEFKKYRMHPVTLQEAKEVFYKEVLVTRNKGTQKKYFSIFRQFLSADDMFIDDYEAIRQHIIEVRNTLPISNNSMDGKMRSLHYFFNFCVEKGWIEKNPITKDIRPKYQAPPPRTYTNEEWTKIIEAAQKNKRLRISLELAYYTAMRLSELVKLEWQDIEENSFIIHGKMGRVRLFPYKLFPEVVQLLEEAKLNGFPKPVPYPSGAMLAKDFRELRKKLDIDPRKNFHTIRKTAINRWSQLGIPVDIRARLAGQSVNVQFKEYMRNPDFEYFEKHLATILQRTSENEDLKR